ncbi:MAG: DUF2306 domain-containing protein [Arenimonas sp.]
MTVSRGQYVQIVKYFGVVVLAFFSYLMLEIILRYVSFDTNAGFLQIKHDYIENKLWLSAFYLHVFSSLFALLAGFTQFSKSIRRNYPQIHRRVGRIYVIDILLITGPAGLLMSFFANGDTGSQLAFFTLSVLWWYFTFQAWRAALARDFSRHRAYMLRSFALTMSAITLRIWKMGLAHYFELPPMDIYRIVAWLGFVPNLLLIEFYLLLEKRNRDNRKSSY